MECTCVNNDHFTVLVSRCDEGCWVSICTVGPSHSKSLSEQNNKSASNFVLSLNTAPQKLFRRLRRPRLWATGDWQLHHNNTLTHTSRLMQSFLEKHQITQVTWPPPAAYIGALQLLAFPKTKTTFEKEEISDCQWDSGKYNGAADGNWENYVRFQGSYFEGDRNIIVLCKIFLISCIFFNKCPCFSYYITGYLLDRPDTWAYYSWKI